MKKGDLLKVIAQKGYDVGFGAKKHFATYDIIEKAPGWIGFASTAVGILGLIFDSLSTKFISAVFVIVGVSGLYISFYNHEKKTYDDTGTKVIRLSNDLKSLYYTVKNLPEDSNFEPYIDQLNEIENKYYLCSISKQILASNWYAHYKFFWEHQIDWINEQLHFKLFRDKIPLSFMFFVFLIILIFIIWLINSSLIMCFQNVI